MAREDKGKIKIRYMEVDLEGTNDTLQEVLRSVTAIAERAVVTRRTLLSTTKQEQLEEPEALQDESSNYIKVEEASETPSSSPNKPKKKRSYGNPQVLSVDFKTGDMPFAAFCQSKNPTKNIQKYLVCAAWFKEQRGEDEISADHVYTCFRTMRWGIQKDMGQTFRSGKQQGYFDNGSKAGMWKITHIGLDVVDKMGSNT